MRTRTKTHPVCALLDDYNILTTDLSNKKIFGLDFLRAIAIILVFLWHYRRYGCPDWLSGIAKFGWTGVDLFFVLSGYLIGGQFLQTKGI